MVRLQARLSARPDGPRATVIARAPEKTENTMTMDTAPSDRSWSVAGNPLPSSSISFGMTLVMAIACGVAAANIYYNQPMLGIMEAAFPGQVTVIGLVPTATQLGFAAGLLLLVPLGDRFDRRRLILIQLAALTLSLAAAALAPGAWSLVVASALVGGTSSVAQQIVPFAAELAVTMAGARCSGSACSWRLRWACCWRRSYREVGPRRRRATAPSSNLWPS